MPHDGVLGNVQNWQQPNDRVHALRMQASLALSCIAYRPRIVFSNAHFPSPWHPERDRARRLVRLNLSSEAAAVC
jgi:tRNA G46 methylase TrmB